MIAGFAKGLQGINEVVQTHVGVIGKLSVRVQRSEKNQIVTILASFQKIPGVRKMHRDLSRIIGAFRVLAFSQSQNRGVDLNGIHETASVAERGGSIVPGPSPHDQH